MDEGASFLRFAFAAAARQDSRQTASRQAYWLFQDAQSGGSAHRQQIGNEKSAWRLESRDHGRIDRRCNRRIFVTNPVRDPFVGPLYGRDNLDLSRANLLAEPADAERMMEIRLTFARATRLSLLGGRNLPEYDDVRNLLRRLMVFSSAPPDSAI
jgi:hypothetical protein